MQKFALIFRISFCGYTGAYQPTLTLIAEQKAFDALYPGRIYHPVTKHEIRAGIQLYSLALMILIRAAYCLAVSKKNSATWKPQSYPRSPFPCVPRRGNNGRAGLMATNEPKMRHRRRPDLCFVAPARPWRPSPDVGVTAGTAAPMKEAPGKGMARQCCTKSHVVLLGVHAFGMAAARLLLSKFPASALRLFCFSS